MSSPYEDILHLPRHVSTTRPPMPRENRAAQFSPFAALSGFEEEIRETARQTDRKIILAEDAIQELDTKLQEVADCIEERPMITLVYFRPDNSKEGGAYTVVTGQVKKIEELSHTVHLMNGEEIPIEDILEISSH